MPSEKESSGEWIEVTAASVLWVCPHCHKIVLGEDGDEAPYCVGPRRDPHLETMIGFKLRDEYERVRGFLSSIATAQSQGTREQTDWMIATARQATVRSIVRPAGMTDDEWAAIVRRETERRS